MRVSSERQYYKQIVSQNLCPKAKAYHRFAFVEQMMGARLLECLDLFKIHPTFIVDLGSGTGHDAKHLGIRYPDARIMQLDLSPDMIAAARHAVVGKHYEDKRDYLCADAEAIPLQAHSVDLVFSNALLPWLPDPELFFEEVRRVLKPGGLFLFSSFGPDTLKECDQVLRRMDCRSVQENATLMDLHTLGDQLLAASFESPVMDSSVLQLEYQSPFALLRDLHRTGWSYAIPSMTRVECKTFLRRFGNDYKDYQSRRGHYLATLEFVLGHAWCGAKHPEKEDKLIELRVL